MKSATDKKTDIFNAAEQLFLQFGLHGVSLAQIAKQARVPASLICHHFGTKEALWGSIVAAHLARLVDSRQILHRQDGTSLERLKAGLHAYYRELAGDEKLRRFMLWCDVEGTILRLPEVQADFEAAVALVAEAQKDGFLPSDHDPRQLFLLLLGTVEYPMMWREDYLGAMPEVERSLADSRFLALLDVVIQGLQLAAIVKDVR